MASAVELVFNTPDTCDAILALLLRPAELAAAACVSKALAQAAKRAWPALRAHHLPPALALADAPAAALAGAPVATLRAYDAAARAAREHAAWSAKAPWRVDELTFVVQVHSTTGALLFAGATKPRLVADKVVLGDATLANAAPHGAPSDLFDDLFNCTASVFVQRAVPGGATRVACIFANASVAIDVTRDMVNDMWSYIDADELGALENAFPWLVQSCKQAFAAVDSPQDADWLLAFTNADAERPPSMCKSFYHAWMEGDLLSEFLGWFAVLLHVPPEQQQEEEEQERTPRKLTARLCCSIAELQSGACEERVGTADLSNKDYLRELLRGLQWQRIC
jgi:hypothetical protein